MLIVYRARGCARSRCAHTAQRALLHPAHAPPPPPRPAVQAKSFYDAEYYDGDTNNDYKGDITAEITDYVAGDPGIMGYLREKLRAARTDLCTKIRYASPPPTLRPACCGAYLSLPLTPYHPSLPTLLLRHCMLQRLSANRPSINIDDPNEVYTYCGPPTGRYDPNADGQSSAHYQDTEPAWSVDGIVSVVTKDDATGTSTIEWFAKDIDGRTYAPPSTPSTFPQKRNRAPRGPH